MRLFLCIATLLALSATAGEVPLEGNWVWRPAPNPSTGEGETPAVEWRRLSPGNRQSGEFSLARQLAEEEGKPMVHPPGFEAGGGIELGVVFRPPDSAKGNLELVFDRIDTFAEIFLDGQPVLETDNAFRTHRIRLPAKDGDRQLLVRLTPTRAEARRRESLLPRAALGGERVVTRRAQLGFGGPAAPATLDLALAYPRLVSWEGVVVREDGVVPAARPVLVRRGESVACERADLRLELAVESESEAEATLSVSCREARAETKVLLKTGHNDLSLPFTLVQPPLWWTRGLGAQEMIEARWELRSGERTLAGTRSFGVRDLTLVRKPDERGESFAFEINGRPLLVRGAHLLPANALSPHRSDTAAVSMAAEAGLNLLRVWAGGSYADDGLLRQCDRLGILLWQDLPFLEGAYPLEGALLDNCLAEIREQVRRMRRHPCLALWCGVTGAAVGREEGEWAARLGTPRAIADERARQLNLFGKVIPAEIGRLDALRPYLAESPLLGWRREPSYRVADLWYRGLEEGPESLETAQSRVGRFVSGHGLTSHPSPAVMGTWPHAASGKDAEPEAYLTSPGRLAEILAHRMGEEGLRPGDRATRAFASRWLQAEAVRTLVSAHRSDPGCSGSVIWHLNDCWPASTASVIDFTGAPKPAYFALRQAFAEDSVRLWFEGDSVRASPMGGSRGILLRLLDARGGVVREARAEDSSVATLGRLRPGEACFALAESGPCRLIRPLPPAYRGSGPELAKSAYRIEARRDPASPLGFSDLTVVAEGVVVGLCLEPTLPGARAMDGMVDLLPGERHVIRVKLGEPRDWRASFRALSWHDLGVAPVPLLPAPPAR